MKMIRFLIVGLVLGFTTAFAEEILMAQTGAQTVATTVVVGTRPAICIKCTIPVRYRCGNAATIVAATTTNGAAADFPGDCYRIKLSPGNDRCSIIAADGVSSFSCDVNGVVGE